MVVAARALHVSTGGANGSGRADVPGLGCARGGDGSSWHYGYESTLPAGTLTALPAALRMNLDVHADEALVSQGAPTAFLQGSESTVSLVNERGTLVLRLSDGGSCSHRTATHTGPSVATTGGWDLAHGSGAYATAGGSGDFQVQADVAPGADNPWSLTLDGELTVGQPQLEVTSAGSSWGASGIALLDFLLRRPTILLRITNTGAGDAFGVRITSAASSTPGVTLASVPPIEVGDLLAGESRTVRLQYQLELLRPCVLLILRCPFQVAIGTAATDALDAPVSDLDAVEVSAPPVPVL